MLQREIQYYMHSIMQFAKSSLIPGRKTHFNAAKGNPDLLQRFL